MSGKVVHTRLIVCSINELKDTNVIWQTLIEHHSDSILCITLIFVLQSINVRYDLNENQLFLKEFKVNKTTTIFFSESVLIVMLLLEHGLISDSGCTLITLVQNWKFYWILYILVNFFLLISVTPPHTLLTPQLILLIN